MLAMAVKRQSEQEEKLVKFRECGELLLGNEFSLKIKCKVYRSSARSAILYGSETWCLREIVKAILRRTERAIVRAMC